MSLRPSATSFCTRTRPVRVLQVLLLLSLFLTVLVPSTIGQCKRNLGKGEGRGPTAQQLWLLLLQMCVGGGGGFGEETILALLGLENAIILVMLSEGAGLTGHYQCVVLCSLLATLLKVYGLYAQ